MLLQATDRGLYCAAADFYIDPWAPVPRAVVTHAHADHLQPGCGSYLVARDGLLVTRARLDDEAPIQTAASEQASPNRHGRLAYWRYPTASRGVANTGTPWRKSISR